MLIQGHTVIKYDNAWRTSHSAQGTADAISEITGLMAMTAIRELAADWAKRFDANSLVILRRATIGYDIRLAPAPER